MKIRAGIALALGTLAFAGIGTTPASAYNHNWGYQSGNQDNCTNWPGDRRCYDYAGQDYNPWYHLHVDNVFAASGMRSCIKATNRNGAARTMAYNQCSNPGAFNWDNYILNGTSPESAAYAFVLDVGRGTFAAQAYTN